MDYFTYLKSRPRRNRLSPSIRSLVRETLITSKDLILPVFVESGQNKKTPISSMPGQYRYSPDLLLKEAEEALELGIPALALFPALNPKLKNPTATESVNSQGLLQETIQMLKSKVPELTLITDVAMDPYSSDGHDGLVKEGKIANDETVEILAAMAISQAEAGADIIAPSDMMDGRIGFIREELDDQGFQDVGILAYSAKYASAFYGPFREALDSAPKSSQDIPKDKKTYQMDPANVLEAIREVELDVEEGADIVMVKPALAYLDIIAKIRDTVEVPVAAYNVSGEYAMIHAAAQNGWLDKEQAMMESLLAIKRAGANMILTYFAKDAALYLKGR